MKTRINVLWLGFGSVSKALLELLALDNSPLIKAPITIIEPLAIGDWVYKLAPQIKHIKKAITKANVEKLLSPYMNKGTICIDLTTDVDCIPNMVLGKKKGILGYINTSLEDWNSAGGHILKTSPEDLIKRSLSYRSYQVEKALGKMKTGTFIQEIGENPGIVSHYVAKGLEDVCNKYGSDTAREFLKKKRFDAVAYHLGLRSIHISEHDTTEARKPRKRGCFISTWSCRGFMAESRDPLQIGWGSHEDQSLGISAPVLDHTHVFPIRGMDVDHKTVGMGLNDMGKPESKLFMGNIIPHGESDSITNWLDYKGYCPTVFYVYKPCQQALESLEEFRDNNYKELPECKVLELTDIKGGYDSVGTTLLFDGGDVPSNIVWWVGSILDYDTTKKYGFKVGNPTGVQVAASMNAAINYMLKHRDKGLLVPEDIDYREFFLKDASRWQGIVLSNEINFE